MTFAECEIVANVGAELRAVIDGLVDEGQPWVARTRFAADLSHMLGQLATLPLENEPDTHSIKIATCDYPECGRTAEWSSRRGGHHRCHGHV